MKVEDGKTISLNLLQALNRHDISGSFEADSVQVYVKGKVAELDQARRFIENSSDASGAFKGSSYELSELLDTLLINLKIGIAEINQMVLTLLHNMLTNDFYGLFNPLMKKAKLE